MTGQLEHRRAAVRRVAVVVDDEHATPAPGRSAFPRSRFFGTRAWLSHGQPHDELAAPPDALAAGFDGTAVQADERTHQRKSDAESLLGAPERRLRLREQGEEPGHHF